MNDCSDVRDRLDPYERGDLAEEEARVVREHLERCPDCARELAAYEALSRLSAAAIPPPLQEDRSRRVLDAVRGELAARASLAFESDVMTMDEVARYLRVTEEDLEEELESLPVFELAGKLRMRRSRLLEWIEERERRARSRHLWQAASR